MKKIKDSESCLKMDTLVKEAVVGNKKLSVYKNAEGIPHKFENFFGIVESSREDYLRITVKSVANIVVFLTVIAALVTVNMLTVNYAQSHPVDPDPLIAFICVVIWVITLVSVVVSCFSGALTYISGSIYALFSHKKRFDLIVKKRGNNFFFNFLKLRNRGNVYYIENFEKYISSLSDSELVSIFELGNEIHEKKRKLWKMRDALHSDKGAETLRKDLKNKIDEFDSELSELNNEVENLLHKIDNYSKDLDNAKANQNIIELLSS